MLLGERGAAGRHGPRHAGPVEADHVGVALAHDDLVGGDDVGLGPVQAVQRLATWRRPGSRGVLVLRRVRRPRQDAAAERHRLAGLGEDREHHPGPERVLQAVAPVGERQAGLAQQLGGDAEARLSWSQSSGAQPSLNGRATSPASPRRRR